jgi:hypothetical protein
MKTIKDFLKLAEEVKKMVEEGKVQEDGLLHACCDDQESWYDVKGIYLTDYGKGSLVLVDICNQRSPSLYEEDDGALDEDDDGV